MKQKESNLYHQIIISTVSSFLLEFLLLIRLDWRKYVRVMITNYPTLYIFATIRMVSNLIVSPKMFIRE